MHGTFFHLIRPLPKDCMNALVGMKVTHDEPHCTHHFCGNNPAERPEGFWREIDLGNPDATDWISEVELRSFQSMRPIWSQIIQLEHTRMALLLGHLERIPSFLSKQMCVQARVDAWHVSCPPRVAEAVQKLGSLTLRDLHDTTTEMQKALGVRKVCRNESEEAAVRVTSCDIHKKLFRSDGTPQRREVIPHLAPPVVVQDFDCVAAAIVGCSFLHQGGPGMGSRQEPRGSWKQ